VCPFCQEFLLAILDRLHEDLNQGSRLASASTTSPAASPRGLHCGRRGSKVGCGLGMGAGGRGVGEGNCLRLQDAWGHLPSAPAPPRHQTTVGDGAWESHLERNRSIMVDTFQVSALVGFGWSRLPAVLACKVCGRGCCVSLCVLVLVLLVRLFALQGQLRSTLHCPNCHTESHMHDTFQYLTVPLPVVLGEFSFRLCRYLDPAECVVELSTGDSVIRGHPSFPPARP
jgi:hypothetical protein